MSIPAPSRRGLLAATAWSVPTVMVASAAPAFAVSEPEPPSACSGTGWYKDPGEGQTSKSYFVVIDCDGGSPVHTVQIFDDKPQVWRVATKQPDGSWGAPGFNDSRRTRQVMLNGTTVITVDFPPR